MSDGNILKNIYHVKTLLPNVIAISFDLTMCLRVRKETKNKHKSNNTTTPQNCKTKADIYTKLLYDIQSCIKIYSTTTTTELLLLHLYYYNYTKTDTTTTTSTARTTVTT